MRNFIDGDVLRYELGAVAQSVDESFGVKTLRPWGEERVRELVDSRIETIIRRTDCEGFEVFLSGGTNYRYDIAVTHPYKGKRTNGKPYHWSTVGQILKEDYGAYVVHGAEADDALSVFARLDPEETVISSRDKDLRIVPCYQYSWKCGKQDEMPLRLVDPLGQISVYSYPSGGDKLIGEGLKFFYGQVLCGDDIDNYKGCPRVGPKKALEVLSPCQSEEELWIATYMQYHLKLGPEEGLKRLLENARLAWLLDDAEVEQDAEHNIYVSPKSLWEPPAPVPTGFS